MTVAAFARCRHGNKILRSVQYYFHFVKLERFADLAKSLEKSLLNKKRGKQVEVVVEDDLLVDLPEEILTLSLVVREWR